MTQITAQFQAAWLSFENALSEQIRDRITKSLELVLGKVGVVRIRQMAAVPGNAQMIQDVLDWDTQIHVVFLANLSGAQFLDEIIEVQSRLLELKKNASGIHP